MNLGKLAGCLLFLGLSFVLLSPVTYASGHATVGLFSDSSCTTQITSTNLGSTVYPKWISTTGNPTGPFKLNIVDPSAATVHSITGIAGAPYCDSTGYTIPTTESTGTWTIQVLDSGNANICFSGCSFTVNGAVPDLPLGALFLILPFLMVYLAARQRIRIG